MTLKVGIDVDDVLFDTLSAWLKRHNEINVDDVKPEDIKSWDIAQYIKKGNKDTLFYILRQNGFWKTVNPVDDAQDRLWKLISEYGDSIDIYIITATHPDGAGEKIRRLFELYPFLDEKKIVMTSSKGILDIDVMIDDNPKNLMEMPAGCFKILFDRPHNQWCEEEDIGAVRASNWNEVYDYVKMTMWLESEDEIEA